MIIPILQAVLILFSVILLIYFFIYAFVFVFNKFFLVMLVEARSMEPTLKSGDKILILSRAYQAFLKRGQIIVLVPPKSSFDITLTHETTYIVPKPLAVKRLLAMEGDKNIVQSNSPNPILKGHIFVLSDNPIGIDSRHWGAVPLSSIRGIVIARIGKV